MPGASIAEIVVSFLTLTLMEIVLGIDNIVFITILTGKLPASQRTFASRLGLGLALITRLGLLFSISWVMGLTTPLFHVLGRAITGRSIILIGGGIFLVGKAAHEIHDKVEGDDEEDMAKSARSAKSALINVVIQIGLLDIVFSLDSVITAVGMVDDLRIMVSAVVVAIIVMLIFAGTIGRFVERHPTVKILALSFLILIGVMLCGEGLGHHLPKGYVYAAMGFALFVEFLNMRVRKKRIAAKAASSQP